MPKEIMATTEKPATKKVVARKSGRVEAPESLKVEKKSASEKKVILRKLSKDNILNYFKVRPKADYIEIKTISAPALPIYTPMARPAVKSIVIFLIVMLNWFGLTAVGRTLANFNDIETSQQNLFQANALDFSLNGDDFSPVVTPDRNAIGTVNLQNDGLMDFGYGAEVQSASGTLCDFLELKDNLTNAFEPLNDFVSATTTFLTIADLVYDARLTSLSKALQNQTCEFKFAFNGEQIDGAGFSDMEEIKRTISTGEWPSVVINKVYYDVDDQHGTEDENEWIELYNPTDQPVDVTDWVIADNSGQSTLASTSPIIIPSLGYAIIANASTTWTYWEIPLAVIKIELNSLIAGGLNNNYDLLVLKDADGRVIDQMNWGTPNHDWPNYSAYSAGIWEPGVLDADEGHILGRLPSGLDTDSVSDWQDLEIPEIALYYPIGGEKWYVGQNYDIRWSASSTNESSSDQDLKIDLYYSNNSGQSWAAIATSTENDGFFNWRVPLFLDYGHYYVPSPKAQIKVVATGPENFMVQAATSSKDFCPPIDYDVLSSEEQLLVDQLLSDGLIDPDDVIRGGVSPAEILAGMESSPEPEITTESVPDNQEIIDATEETADTSNQSANSGDNVELIEITGDETVTVEVIPEDEDTAETTETSAEEPTTETPADETATPDSINNQETINTDEPVIEESEAETSDEQKTEAEELEIIEPAAEPEEQEPAAEPEEQEPAAPSGANSDENENNEL